MKPVLVKSSCMDDWYMVERAEHEHRYWDEQVSDNVWVLRYSGRLDPKFGTCVEGTMAEMQALARAIQQDACCHFKRCAVAPCADGVHFWSPRNSEEPGVVPYEDALEWAADVLAGRYVEKLPIMTIEPEQS